MTQQLSKSQVRRETKAWDTLTWVLKGGFGLLSMLDETKEQREPCLFEPAPLQAHSRSVRSVKRWLGDRLLGKWPRDSPICTST